MRHAIKYLILKMRIHIIDRRLNEIERRLIRTKHLKGA